MTARRFLLALGLLCIGLAACGGDAAPRTGSFTTVVDTVGDTTVVRTSGDIPAAEELRLTEVWRIGDPDGDETTSFGMVHSVVVSGNDEVYVFETSAQQLRHYAADGSLRRVLGGKGSGPGEYTRSNGLAVLTDGRIALWDAGNSRINIYTAADSFDTQWRPPLQGYGTSNNSLLALNDGGLAMRAFVRDTTLTREALGRGAWFRFHADGTLRDTLLQPFYGDPPPSLIARREGSSSSRPVPFLPTPQASLGPDGSIIGSPGAPYVVYAASNGRPLRIERSVGRVPVPDEHRAQLREQIIWNLRMTDPAWTWDGPDMPREKAPVAGVRAMADGQLLVSVSTPSEPYEPDPPRVVEGQAPQPLVKFRSLTAYELFTADGRLRGRFTMPRGAQLHALRGDDAWGTVIDSLDIPYLVRWRLEAPTP